MALVRFLKPYRAYNSGEIIGRSQADADELIAFGLCESVSDVEWQALQSPPDAVVAVEAQSVDEPKSDRQTEVRPSVMPRGKR